MVSSGHWFEFTFASQNLPACAARVLNRSAISQAINSVKQRRSGQSSHRISGNRLRNGAPHRPEWTEVSARGLPKMSVQRLPVLTYMRRKFSFVCLALVGVAPLPSPVRALKK